MKFISSLDPLDVQAIQEYWTDERIANATPTSLLQHEMPKKSQQKADEFFQAEREMCFCGSENKRYDPRYAAKVNIENDPYRKVGKLYYTRGNDDSAATAQFVGDSNIIMTTAHCLKEPDGEWSTNMLFRRAYKLGVSAQVIDIVVGSPSITMGWEQSGGHFLNKTRWDYGFAKTVEPSNVGYLGLSPNLPDSLSAVGYPYNYGNKRKYMCEARGTVGFNILGIVEMLGNFMEHGGSGGAWFPRYGRKRVVGINSGFDEGNVYGPTFDHHTFGLFYFTKNLVIKKVEPEEKEEEKSPNKRVHKKSEGKKYQKYQKQA